MYMSLMEQEWVGNYNGNGGKCLRVRVCKEWGRDGWGGWYESVRQISKAFMEFAGQETTRVLSTLHD